MALFKRDSIEKVLCGTKTQTRRLHKRTWKVGKKYAIRNTWFSKPLGYIRITRKFRQRLGAISLKDVKKEGYDSLEQFQAAWVHINHKWNPDEIVTVYEFEASEK
jgi:hypothetical protein